MEQVAVFVFCVLQMMFNNVNSQRLYEGDSCFLLNTTNIGECRKTTDCPAFMLISENEVSLRNSRYQFAHCGFSGIIQIVCCPELSTSAPITQPPITQRVTVATSRPTPSITVRAPISTPRISQRQCESYANIVRDLTIVSSQIFNGELVSQNEFPHMAALGYEIEGRIVYRCGATLISDRYVLTAGHCVQTIDSIPPTVVKLGTIELTDPGIMLGVENAIPYPSYNRSLRYDDIAVLRLNSTVEFAGFVYPACLDTDRENPETNVIATGWGQTSFRTEATSPFLLKANFTAVSFSECNTEYTANSDRRRLPNGIRSDQICFINRNVNNSDTCPGDSGGPLQVQSNFRNLYKIVGITSFGRTCGSLAPSVNTRVSSYLDWIENEVWP